MPFDFQRARPLLQCFDLPKLFVEELGWEPCRQKLTLCAGDTDFALAALAEKRGFVAWLCESPTGSLPDRAARLKLDRKLSETSFEHLIVFVTSDHSHQSWMWVRREQGKPLAARTHEFDRSQPGDSLLQKLQILYVSLEEEEAGLSTVAVAGRARAAFDIECVTKAFYRDFDTHRKAFLELIDGFPPPTRAEGKKKFDPDQEWYASVMLNRLMFVYFIQRKGFLDGDHDYLRNRLKRCQKEQGKDRFYTFYRYFLLRLFHEGFGNRRKDRAPDLEKLLGNIPYLNGGLFDVHELEKPERYGKAIQIPDKAFEHIFNYFDQYQWHLDERPLRADNEINPDVLGYIFEKYINQKQMGAYYTKEDITEYISKNTVLPFLFDAARGKCKVAFENPSGPTVWDLLRENPDRYIYPAVRRGADKKLPPDIAAGLDTTKPNLIERRKAWNKPAPGEYALPTEIWREVVARRQRCEEVRRKLAAGDVRGINDFITLNLDLRQFAQDVIQNCEGPDLLMAFWQAITAITVLDPTGGSGAFIFAALNILEPLYEACLDRMEAFLAEWGENGRKAHPNYHKKFSEVLVRVGAHPNRRYFILKSIILNNLYAVDIMEEAVEICKLRLFLKLAAQVEPDATRDNLGIEPLPDIDFNIRAGNTLVGYATADEVRSCLTVDKTKGADQMRLGVLGEKDAYDAFEDKLQIADAAFSSFREQQEKLGGTVTAADKLELQTRLKALEDELNRQLADEYGIKVSDKAAYAKWVKSHQPFHWFIQFYGILNGGGFDVIIGNPPYVEYKDVKDSYRVRGFQTLECGDLYAFTMERAYRLLQRGGRVGLIVPVSIFCVDGFKALQTLSLQKLEAVWASSYANRPAQLFDGAQKRLTIVLGKRGEATIPMVHTTAYYRWHRDEFPNLFRARVYYAATHSNFSVFPASLEKLGSTIEVSAFSKLACKNERLETAVTSVTKHRVFYTRKFGYFLAFLDFVPCVTEMCTRKQIAPSELKDLSFPNAAAVLTTIASLSSSTFFWFWNVLSDCRNLNRRDILSFPLNPIGLTELERGRIAALGGKYLKALKDGSYEMQKSGLMLQTFEYSSTKPILDEIDTILAEHYGFTAEELDFILNYDIKYRLGRDKETDDE